VVFLEVCAVAGVAEYKDMLDIKRMTAKNKVGRIFFILAIKLRLAINSLLFINFEYYTAKGKSCKVDIIQTSQPNDIGIF
jgi:hypothetical protein